MSDVSYQVLGPLEATRGTQRVELPRGRARAVLAYLLVHRNRLVTTERLVDELWEDPPPTAVKMLHIAVSQLRRVLGDGALVTEPGGYRLNVSPAQIDLERFQSLAQDGRESLAAGDPTAAAAQLRGAIALWREPLFADVQEPFVEPERAAAEAARMAAIEDRIDADLTLRRHAEVIAELERLTAEHPLRERLTAHLMLALYRSGRQADALSTYRDAHRALRERAGIEPSATLKRLERAMLLQDPSLEPVAAERVAKGVPVPTTTLVGREQELAEIAAILERPDVHLLTLTGPGGAGKTRLAIETARQLTARLQTRVVFVALDAVTDPALVLPTIAAAVEGPFSDADGVSTLATKFQNGPQLLVLDSFEHLLDAAATLTELLTGAPELKILVTSRTRLRLSAEHEFGVQPLPVPDPLVRDAEQLRRVPSVELFVERSRAVDPAFAAEPGDLAHVAEICRRLDGLPLSLELAAAQARLLTPSALLKRLSAQLDLLSTRTRDAPARHRTLRATVDWSYNLLEARERTLLARLSVFVGGWTLEAAEAVWADSEGELLPGLSSLIDASLVQRAPGENLRFRMLDSIRDYASERLAASADADSVRARHVQFYLGLAESQSQRAADLEWLEGLDREHGNIRAALSFAIDSGDAERAVQLAGALTRFWDFHGHYEEGARWFEAALALEGDIPPFVRMKALAGAGVLAGEQVENDDARRFFEQSLAIARELDNSNAIAIVLSNLATLAAAARDYAAARPLYDEAAELQRASGDVRNLTLTLQNLGSIAIYSGDFERAAASLEESEELARANGDEHGLCCALMDLGRLATARGDYEGAGSSLHEAITLARRLGWQLGIAGTLELLGAVAAAGPDGVRAATLLGASDALREAIARPRTPDEELWRERTLAALQTSLGAEFGALYERGRLLPLADALELAAEPSSAGSQAPISA